MKFKTLTAEQLAFINVYQIWLSENNNNKTKVIHIMNDKKECNASSKIIDYFITVYIQLDI